ncbi:MAG: isoprenylcysteine carboxylmethyltransferase family protein [Gemmatimonadaceae bacterium]|nr:isoprenylcysteine carboxylmethyltransferase family protein [Gemmatimonadaceae bacterium]
MNPKQRSLIATVVLVVSVGLLVLQDMMIARGYAGLALQVLALALMVWARLTFGTRSFHATANPTAGGLVTTGPYRYWRHPIYAAVLLFVWAGVLTHGVSPISSTVALAVLATLMTAVRIQAEEQMLLASVPEYAAYAARTRRLIPFVF